MGDKAGRAQNTDTEIICTELLATDVRVNGCVWEDRREEKKRAKDRPPRESFIMEKLKRNEKSQKKTLRERPGGKFQKGMVSVRNNKD